ncbi:HAMP domain-containing histidine kinase [Shewanella sp. SNU WT4]|uniref:sensor histidine kinase n=1 Tax=Shewanella sp. SNU WT4 TaxID=2590015 RepID=UPI001F1091D4|nr:HAMP domain-containing histidine kinase [Shewanella sp. SNU WT4]
MPKFSLKRSYQFYGLVFLAVTLLINMIIPLCMMCTGMFSMHQVALRNTAQAAEVMFQNGLTELSTDNIHIYADWQQVPDKIKALNNYQIPDENTGIVNAHEDGPFVDTLSVHITQDGRPLYMWLHYDVTHDLLFAPKNMTAILLLVIMTFGVVASLAFHMQKKVINPVHKISQAIKLHDWQSSKDFSFPKQGYAELQSIVDALNHSLQQLQQTQQRELDFLRFASHELRTPVAICQSSFELITLQQGELTGPLKSASQATSQMKSLIETLLWLTNKTSVNLAPRSINPCHLLKQLVAEQEYAQDKPGLVTIDSDDSPLILLVEPLSIMLNNLIRNALEHGDSQVLLTQQHGLFTISNPICAHNTVGFGLGLILVARLAEQLNWPFTSHIDGKQFVASLKVDTAPKFGH